MFELASLLLLLQNMLLEIEEKVLTLSELSLHSEVLLLEGQPETRDEAEQLSRKLRTLKGSLVELQRMLQDKQINFQVNSSKVYDFICPSIQTITVVMYIYYVYKCLMKHMINIGCNKCCNFCFACSCLLFCA